MDLHSLNKYKENAQIEAKRAAHCLPRSIWETYSAFANTFGGTIFLGVVENEDKSLSPEHLSNPDKLIKEFWDGLNNKTTVSLNILSNKAVSKLEVDGKTIIAISIPMADRLDKPVYVGTNPYTGTYRRKGESDYKCSIDEIKAMMRDASPKTQDMRLIEKMGLDVFDEDSIASYRSRLQNNRRGTFWDKMDDKEFIYRIGAVGRSEDGKLHPTGAGLLLFGHEYEIVKEYPNYFLDYQEQLDNSTRWTDRVASHTGNWSGNIYDFFYKVYPKLVEDIKVPFKLDGVTRVDDTPVHRALREALLNCLIHADYYERCGVTIIKRKNEIIFSNPGLIRIGVDVARLGGLSDPRNSTLIKAFNLIEIGERSGNGVPSIFYIWETNGWREPTIQEQVNPDRTILTLAFENRGEMPLNDKDLSENNSNNFDNLPVRSVDKIGDIQRNAILEYLNQNEYITSEIVEQILEIKAARARRILSNLITEGKLIPEGANRNRKYRLKN